MKKLTALLPLLIMACNSDLGYPISRTVDHTDQYHGTEVSDPYRWLEDFTSEEALAWVENQNTFADSYFETPFKDAVAESMARVWESESLSTPFRVADKTFYYYNDGTWQQSKLMVRAGDEGSFEELLDPNTFSEDGTVSLGGASISPDGKYLAYSISDGGSDWRVWRVLDIDGKSLLDDELLWSKFSGAEWLPDSSGFYYTRYPEPVDEELADINLNPELRLHLLGNEQSQDILIISDPENPRLSWGITVSDDGQYKVLTTNFGTDERNLISIAVNEHQFIPVIEELQATYNFIDSLDETLWFFTNHEAPNGKIVSININRLEDGFTDVIAETENAISSYNILAGHFVISYMVDTNTEVHYFDAQGQAHGKLELDIDGTLYGFGGKKEDTTTYFSVTNYIQPSKIYEIDLVSGEQSVFWEESLNGYHPDEYVSSLVFYPSKDGTMIPLHISHSRDLEVNEQTPVLLYGYGGFNISLLPRFSKTFLAWMEQGGVFALAHLRGGGEYGATWHEQGMLLNKQNVFDDFAYAARYLHGQAIGSPRTTAIQGGSNGGLLVGATMLQNPDLFGFAIPQVGVMDMLRFNQFTIGWAWESDYGSPQEPEHFQNLLSYSPYHNIVEGACYPTTLVTTSERDDRVVPSHSYKFAARLQAAQGCTNPILLRVETRAGHGAGTPKDKVIEQVSEIYGLAFEVLNNN
jgi:prolyl oligopeptidase